MQQLRLFLCVATLALLAVPIIVAQDVDSTYYYRLTSGWQKGKSIDVINDGDKNNQLHLVNTDNFTGQMWKITNFGDGFVRLTNGWQKDKSLDVINDGKNNQVHLRTTENVSGQQWKLEKTNNRVE